MSAAQKVSGVESPPRPVGPEKLMKKLGTLRSEEADIQATLNDLHAELSSALVTGGDSTFLRRKVRDCQVTLTDVRERLAEVRGEIDRLIDAEIHGKSLDTVRVSCAHIEKKLAEFNFEEITMIAVKVDLDETISRGVERARHALKIAEGAHDAAKENATTIGARIQSLETERQTIISLRMQGAASESQEARLAVVAADLDGLRPLLVDAASQVAALDPTAERDMLTHHEKIWAMHVATREHETIAARTAEIETALLGFVAAQHAAGVRAGKGQHLSLSYRPSDGLRRLIGYGAVPGSL